MKHLFIINPVAGQKKATRLVPQIEQIMARNKAEFHLEYTVGPGHATDIARAYAKKENLRIYAVGGDGTLNEVLNGMVESNCNLSVIPAGSGNDFFRSISDKRSANILQRTVDGNERVIDIGKVNGKYFLNISSIGFDAEVANNANNIKDKTFLSGSAAYLTGILATILKNRSYEIDIIIDGKLIHKKLLLTAIANGRFYGGGILPAPEAALDDGLLDICTVDSLPKAKIIRMLPKYMRGSHADMEEVKFYKCKKISFSSSQPMFLNIDGEVESVTYAEFEIVPAVLKFVFPLHC